MDIENTRIPSIEKDDDEISDITDDEVEEEGEEEHKDDVDDEEEEEEEEGDEEEEDDDEEKEIEKDEVQEDDNEEPVHAAEMAIAEGDEEEEYELMDEDYIQRVHPEAILPDSRELRAILADSTVVRRSRPLLSKYEATTVVGMRAQQIMKGSSPFIDTDETDPIEIALKELRAKLIPVIIRRVMPDGKSEYWRLSELTYYE